MKGGAFFPSLAFTLMTDKQKGRHPMKKLLSILLAVLMIAGLLPLAALAEDEVVEINYWQYYFETKVNLMDELIAEFEAQNPGIKVVQTTFPYDSYEEKLAASIQGGTAPEIVNLFYGWVPKYVKSGVLQPLPGESFTTEKIEERFIDLVQIGKFDGKYYAIPTAVRTLALIYNKDLLKEAGYDAPPATLDEMVEIAKACTKRDDKGVLTVEGLTFQPSAQLHSFYRPVLLDLFGAQTLSEDNKTVLWNQSEAGYEALEFLCALGAPDGVGENNFMGDDVTAFINNAAAMTIDGSFRVGTLKNNADKINWGVAEIPGKDGRKSTFGSFWCNGVLSGVTGKKLEATVKFLEFLTSHEVMKTWTERIGELGAGREIATDEDLLKDEVMAPFIRGLEYAHSYFYVDEAADRQVILDAIDMVLLEGMDVHEVLDYAVEQAQEHLDEYWN